MIHTAKDAKKNFCVLEIKKEVYYGLRSLWAEEAEEKGKEEEIIFKGQIQQNSCICPIFCNETICVI